MTEDKLSQTTVNNQRTQAHSDTQLTQPRSGFDPSSLRSQLYAKRKKYGAFTPIGRRISSLIEQTDNHAIADSTDQKCALEHFIANSVREIEQLTSRVPA